MKLLTGFTGAGGPLAGGRGRPDSGVAEFAVADRRRGR
jgi:hypothetical protein